MDGPLLSAGLTRAPLPLIAWPRLLGARLASFWSGTLFPGDSTATHAEPAAVTTAVWALLVVVAGLLYFGRLNSPLLEPEEAVYAEVPREMVGAGNWIMPLRHGLPYYEKPPLLYWLAIAGYQLFGIQEWAARLGPCAAGFALVLFTFWWGKKTFGLRAGLAAALILCLSPRFLHQARMLTMDGLLCLWIIIALGLGQRALQAGRLRAGPWCLSAAACALGILSKGPVALLLVVVPLLLYQRLDRRAAQVGVLSWLAYFALAGVLAAPWFVAMAWLDPFFLRAFFWTHHVEMRFLQPLHPEPFWFYIPALVLGMLPWTLLLPALLRLLVRRGALAARQRPPALGFMVLASFWCLLFYSAAECKRTGYILPAMPTLALALGWAFDRSLPGRANLLAGLQVFRIRARLPLGVTVAVLAAGIACAILAVSAGLMKPSRGLIIISLALAVGAWSIYHCRRQAPLSSWATCGLVTFALLFLSIHYLLPEYYRKFSMRTQIRALMLSPYDSHVPIACYPHSWDSIHFYFARADIHTYGREERDRLLADLAASPQTIVFVKTGPALEDLVQHLPATLEFITTGQARSVVAGVVRERTSIAAHTDFVNSPIAKEMGSD